MIPGNDFLALNRKGETEGQNQVQSEVSDPANPFSEIILIIGQKKVKGNGNQAHLPFEVVS